MTAEEVEKIFKKFHEIIMGDEDKKLDDFIKRYEDTKIRNVL